MADHSQNSEQLKQNAIDNLNANGMVFVDGFCRFKQPDGSVSTFMFHIDEMRDVSIGEGIAYHTVQKRDVPAIRLELSLIGGSAYTFCAHPVHDLQRMRDFAACLLYLRDEFCGLPEVTYSLEQSESYYYKKPNVSWSYQD